MPKYVSNVNGVTKERFMIDDGTGYYGILFGNLIILNIDSTPIPVAQDPGETLIYAQSIDNPDPHNYTVTTLNDGTNDYTELHIHSEGYYLVNATIKVKASTQNTEFTFKVYINDTVVATRNLYDIDATGSDWTLAGVYHLPADCTLKVSISSSGTSSEIGTPSQLSIIKIRHA